MAFLIDRGIAAESEEEFDAEGDRYEELKNKLLDGQTMKYEEMEELLTAAKSKNDQKVINILKNVVDDPATGAVTESEEEPTKAELLDKLIKMCEPGSGLYAALEEIKDKFALDESNAYGWDADKLITSNVGEIILGFQASCEPGSELAAAAERIKTALPPAVRQKMAGMRIRRLGKIVLNRSYNFQKTSLLAFIKSIDKIFSGKREYDAARNLAQDVLDEFFDRGDNLTQEAVDALRKAGFEPGRQGITPDMLTFAPPTPGLDEINSVLREYGIVAEPFQGKTSFVLYLTAAKAASVDESAASDPTGAPLDTLDAVIGKLKGANDLTADDAWVEDSKEIVLSYENVGWYENLDKWAEDPSDDIESDLTKIYDALSEAGYGLQYSRKAVEKAIADAAVEAASDPEHITSKENRFGDWDNVATCNVHIPFEIVDGPTNVFLEEDDFQEKEELLPDCVVNEAIETLRRMY